LVGDEAQNLSLASEPVEGFAWKPMRARAKISNTDLDESLAPRPGGARKLRDFS
jgi:hypothetical protein